MAHRDRSQGFGFVYVDIATLLKQFKNETNASSAVNEQDIQSVNLNKDIKPQETTEKTKTIAEIQSNLDRLQSLHHKLHAMLEELNQAAQNKKK